MLESLLGGMANSAFNAYLNQSFAKDQQEDSQSFNAEQAAINRQWQQMMYMNRYQFTVADLKKADLNPMLAYGASPPGPGSGATASSGIASAPGAPDVAHGAQAFSAAQLNQALMERAAAETDRTNAEADEIRARTPTHEVTRASLTQGIEKSKAEIEKIIQETATSHASAANIAQQTQNLKETIPQIQATVAQLKTLAALNVAHIHQAGAQTGALKALEGLTTAQQGEVIQRVKANLPALDAALKELERQAKKLEIPAREQASSVSEGYTGALAATLRALNPFSDFLKSR